MRKRVTANAPTVQEHGRHWLNIEHAATVEVTSEDKDFPIECALTLEGTRGWRAATPGPQTIRLLFDEPRDIRCISLVFEEDEVERTQEFVLRSGGPFREIVRQQWNFSPPSSTREAEEYRAEIPGVTTLELVIVPDISRGAARASLKALRLV